MRKYFELTKPYKFDPTDLTAIIYLVCAVLGIMQIDATFPFFIGSAVGMAFCWQGRRINLLVLNGALFILNCVNLYRMIF